MAPSKYIVASFIAFLVVLAATLQPSFAISVQAVKPAADQQASTNGGDVVKPLTWPGFPNIPGLPPLLPLPHFPLPSFPPLPPVHGCSPLPPIPRFPVKPPHSGTPSSPSLSPPASPSPPSSPRSPSPPVLSASPPSSPSRSSLPVVSTPSTPSEPTECLSSLMGLMPCIGFLTNTSALTPPSTCCDGFKSLINNAPICLCHGLNGDINKLMPAPMDFMRMISLPGTCNVPLPLQTIAQCSTRPVPPLMPPSPAAAGAPSPKPSS